MAPFTPTGDNTGPSPPAACDAIVAAPPLGAKAFASELSNLETGLEEDPLVAARRLRQLLSTNRDRLIQEVIARGWVPLLLGWLQLSQWPAVQVEALWALTNIAAGTSEHTQVLITHGAIPTLVKLLSSSNVEVVEQALWVLGNLAGDGTSARDSVLSSSGGVLGPIAKCMATHSNLVSLLRIGSWTLSNLFDGQPRPHLDISIIMPTLTMLLDYEDTEVLSHTCWALSHLCDGPSCHMKAVAEAGACWKLVQLLRHPGWRVTKPALRTIGNIVCAEDETDYTQFIIEVPRALLKQAGAVPCLRKLVGHSNREIQKEACWTLSNIAAGKCWWMCTVEQIQTVLDSGAMPKLVVLATDPATDAEVRSEACWVVLNATSCGSDAQIEYLVQWGCLPILVDLLDESSMVMMALEGLERVLQVGDQTGAGHAGMSYGGHQRRLHRIGSGSSDGKEQPEGSGSGSMLEVKYQGQNGDGVAPCAGTGGNLYASLIEPSRIEGLDAHASSAVAKRAARVWKTYFVTCAICSISFGRNSPETRFCPECKCYVCVGCDCSMFHLSYQEEFWAAMEGEEGKAKQAKSAAKSKKKAKKKDKKKKAAKQTKQKDEGEQGHDALDGDAVTSPAAGAAAPVSPSPLPVTVPVSEPAMSPVAPDDSCEQHSGKVKRRSSHSSNASNTISATASASASSSPGTSDLTASPGVSSGRAKGSDGDAVAGGIDRARDEQQTEVSPEIEPQQSDPQTEKSNSTGNSGGRRGSGLSRNEALVSYLEETGSILALAQLLEDEEDNEEMSGSRPA
ncbi:unnamed protein product [Chrysoparadoxa australica]